MTDHAALEQLAGRLWDERRIVTYLLFKLTVTRLLLAADERRFVPDALREVERTVELLREGELQRENALRELAERWQLAPAELTLQELVRRAPAPFDHTFAEHLEAFQELAAEIETVAHDNRALARVELDHLTDTIVQLTGSGGGSGATYDASGQLGNTTAVGGRLREAL
jgi:hypothetical protein